MCSSPYSSRSGPGKQIQNQDTPVANPLQRHHSNVFILLFFIFIPLFFFPWLFLIPMGQTFRHCTIILIDRVTARLLYHNMLFGWEKMDERPRIRGGQSATITRKDIG